MSTEQPTGSNARPRGSRARDEDATSALFVRLPREQAERLDRAAFELKVPKQRLVSGLVERYVEPSTPAGLAALSALVGAGDQRRRVSLETDDSSLVVGHHAFCPREAEVLTLADVAELLQVEPDTVARLAEAGKLPGRRLGEEWRFARGAVLAWLAGSPG